MSKRINILIGDSSITVRESIKEFINQCIDNYDILEAEDGQTIFETLDAYKDINLLFLANTLNDMSGERVLSLIREKEEYNSVRIVMTMSEENKDKLANFTNLGIFGFLVKPFNVESMEKIVKKFITLR